MKINFLNYHSHTPPLLAGERVVFNKNLVKTKSYYAPYKGHTFVVERDCHHNHFVLNCQDKPELLVMGAVHGQDLIRLDAPLTHYKPYEQVFSEIAKDLKGIALMSARFLRKNGCKATLEFEDWDSDATFKLKKRRSKTDELSFSVSMTLVDPAEQGHVPLGHYAILLKIRFQFFKDTKPILWSFKSPYTADANELKQQTHQAVEICKKELERAFHNAPPSTKVNSAKTSLYTHPVTSGDFNIPALEERRQRSKEVAKALDEGAEVLPYATRQFESIEDRLAASDLWMSQNPPRATNLKDLEKRILKAKRAKS